MSAEVTWGHREVTQVISDPDKRKRESSPSVGGFFRLTPLCMSVRPSVCYKLFSLLKFDIRNATTQMSAVYFIFFRKIN